MCCAMSTHVLQIDRNGLNSATEIFVTFGTFAYSGEWVIEVAGERLAVPSARCALLRTTRPLVNDFSRYGWAASELTDSAYSSATHGRNSVLAIGL